MKTAVSAANAARLDIRIPAPYNVETRLESPEAKADVMNEAIGTILEWADEVHTAKSLPMPWIL